ncbi:PaaI family thioesterase [Bacteroides mediterraneensis]|uniref:PaaI family thioesterase n=1 Tax=Bacteroides mediterraneensis TaxID=1841856 RepID=UPI0019576DAF|nr:PaaI family thioesterase [Bacteroides mediterraneensis]MBM6781078.1 PaaI family thioesterase [Bacteroides mediterraneensis]
MRTLKELLSADRFAAEAGVELLEISPGYAKARMKVTETHLNAGGVCQGGALFTLADLTFAAVANSREKLTLSLNANITFLRAVSEGYVYAEANEVYNHFRVPFVEVRLMDEQQQLIAVMTSSGYRKNEELNVEGLE